GGSEIYAGRHVLGLHRRGPALLLRGRLVLLSRWRGDEHGPERGTEGAVGLQAAADVQPRRAERRVAGWRDVLPPLRVVAPPCPALSPPSSQANRSLGHIACDAPGAVVQGVRPSW